jgi:hypothetical protein
MPLASCGCLNATSVKLPGCLSCRKRSQFSEDRTHLISKHCGSLLVGKTACVETPKLDPAGLSRCQSILGTAADQGTLFLSESGIQVEHEGVRIGTKLSDDERHAMFHEPADVVDIAA